MDSTFSPRADSRAAEIFDEAPDGVPSFLDRLFDQGLLVRTGVDGLYGRSGAFESVVDALDRLITRLGAADGAEVMRFPLPGGWTGIGLGPMERAAAEAEMISAFWMDRDSGRFLANAVTETGVTHRLEGMALPVLAVPVTPFAMASGRCNCGDNWNACVCMSQKPGSR